MAPGSSSAPVQVPDRPSLEGAIVCRGRTWRTDQVGPSVAAPSGTPPGVEATYSARAKCSHGTLTAQLSSFALMGRGVAAAPVLGAAGALFGTRFQTTVEAALAGPSVSKHMVERGGQDSGRSGVLDIVRGTSSAVGIRPCTGGSPRGREG